MKAQLESEVTMLKAENATLASKNAQLNSQISSLDLAINNLNAQLSSDAAQISSLQSQANHPTLSLWNACGSAPCTLNSTYWQAAGVPDTFTYNIRFTADYPVGVYILTLPQYVQFKTCPSNANVESQVACVTGTYSYFPPATSLNGVFHLAEGCGGYVAVYYSNHATVFHPDVSVTYNPSPTATGACA